MPSTSVDEPLQAPQPVEPLSFVYKGVEYDATAYAPQHPGGDTIIKNMSTERKDFTEYFRSLHSEKAEKILKSFPVVSKVGESTPSKEYFELLSKVEHLFQPTLWKDVSLVALVGGLFLLACFTKAWYIAIPAFTLSQVITGWVAHSMVHSRVPRIYNAGRIITPLIGGMCDSWWSPKHNAHHMFTNSLLYDDDIKHEYKVYLYPFLYLKWRFDSIVSSFTNKKYTELGLLLVNYWFLSFQSIWMFVVGVMIGGFYSAFVLIGNHEREVRFPGTVKLTFMEHQITTCRNYTQRSLVWLMLMGGMQFQTEHHLFPQVLFYNLPKASAIIKAELEKKGKKLIYGPVI